MTSPLLTRLALNLGLFQQPLHVLDAECAVGMDARPGTTFEIHLELDGNLIRPILIISRPGYDSKSVRFDSGFTYDELKSLGGSWSNFQQNAEIIYDLFDDEDAPDFRIFLSYRGQRLGQIVDKRDFSYFFEYWHPEEPDDVEHEIDFLGVSA